MGIDGADANCSRNDDEGEQNAHQVVRQAAQQKLDFMQRKAADHIGSEEPGRPGISMRLRRIALITATVRLVVLSFRIAFLM